jgi:DNA-binding NarL/FixJ family response regulator
MLVSQWEKNITLYKSEILHDIEELPLYAKMVLVLDYASCYKNLPTIIKIAKNAEIKILLLDSTPSFVKGKNVLSLGVYGYGNILLSSSYFNSALQSITDGMIWVYPEFITSLIRGFDKQEKPSDAMLEHLTPRELDTALLVKSGLSNNEISEQLDISVNTVKTHIKKIYEKLSVKNRLSLSLLFSNQA